MGVLVGNRVGSMVGGEVGRGVGCKVGVVVGPEDGDRVGDCVVVTMGSTGKGRFLGPVSSTLEVETSRSHQEVTGSSFPLYEPNFCCSMSKYRLP